MVLHYMERQIKKPPLSDGARAAYLFLASFAETTDLVVQSGWKCVIEHLSRLVCERAVGFVGNFDVVKSGEEVLT